MSKEHDHDHGEISKYAVLFFILSLLVLILANVFNLTILFFVSYLMVSYTILIKTYQHIKIGIIFDENFLMALATIAALGIGEYNEAILILVFFQVGEFFEGFAVNRSTKSIEQMLDKRKHTVIDKVKGIVNVKEVQIGDILEIHPNEVISLDGKVLNDNVELDESSINGESKTKIYNKDDEVLSGVINTSIKFDLEVTQDYANSYSTKVTNLIKEAHKNKSDTEKFIRKFARVYTPIVVFLAIFIGVVQFLLNNDIKESITTAVIFLIISCPCALVISIPLGYFGGIGLASKNNILIKGSQHLEEMLHITDIAFDKTGTLTDGKFKVIELKTTIDETLFKNLVGSSEQNSSHVIARQLIKELDYKDLKLDHVTEVVSKGLEFKYKNSNYKVGNSKFTKCNNITEDYTTVYVTQDDKYIGHIKLGDKLHDSSILLFNRLKELNINTHILSGDNSSIISKVATELNCTNAYGSMLAEDKHEYVKKLKDDNKHVIFIGDGVNDAASIVEADLGISIGVNATTLSVESSDVVLSSNNAIDIIKLRNISKKTRNIVVQNIILSLGVKILFLVLATLNMSTVYEAIIADVGVALVAILNAYRLIYTKINLGNDV